MTKSNKEKVKVLNSLLKSIQIDKVSQQDQDKTLWYKVVELTQIYSHFLLCIVIYHRVDNLSLELHVFCTSLNYKVFYLFNAAFQVGFIVSITCMVSLIAHLTILLGKRRIIIISNYEFQ